MLKEKTQEDREKKSKKRLKTSIAPPPSSATNSVTTTTSPAISTSPQKIYIQQKMIELVKFTGGETYLNLVVTAMSPETMTDFKSHNKSAFWWSYFEPFHAVVEGNNIDFFKCVLNGCSYAVLNKNDYHNLAGCLSSHVNFHLNSSGKKTLNLPTHEVQKEEQTIPEFIRSKMAYPSDDACTYAIDVIVSLLSKGLPLTDFETGWLHQLIPIGGYKLVVSVLRTIAKELVLFLKKSMDGQTVFISCDSTPTADSRHILVVRASYIGNDNQYHNPLIGALDITGYGKAEELKTFLMELFKEYELNVGAKNKTPGNCLSGCVFSAAGDTATRSVINLLFSGGENKEDSKISKQIKVKPYDKFHNKTFLDSPHAYHTIWEAAIKKSPKFMIIVEYSQKVCTYIRTHYYLKSQVGHTPFAQETKRFCPSLWKVLYLHTNSDSINKLQLEPEVKFCFEHVKSEMPNFITLLEEYANYLNYFQKSGPMGSLLVPMHNMDFISFLFNKVNVGVDYQIMLDDIKSHFITRFGYFSLNTSLPRSTDKTTKNDDLDKFVVQCMIAISPFHDYMWFVNTNLMTQAEANSRREIGDQNLLKLCELLGPDYFSDPSTSSNTSFTLSPQNLINNAIHNFRTDFLLMQETYIFLGKRFDSKTSSHSLLKTYMQKTENRHPIVKEIIKVVAALDPNTLRVEHDNSHLQHISSGLKANISTFMIQVSLLIKFNEEAVDMVKHNESVLNKFKNYTKTQEKDIDGDENEPLEGKFYQRLLSEDYRPKIIDDFEKEEEVGEEEEVGQLEHKDLDVELEQKQEEKH